MKSYTLSHRFFLLAFLLILMAVPWMGSDFYIELTEKAIILAIFAMSLDLLVGFTGLVSFGHAAYFGIAAYTIVLVSPEYAAGNFWIVLPAAIGISTLMALIVGIFVLRTKGVYFIMVTLAFAQLFYFLFHDTDLGGGSDGIYLNFRPSTAIGSWIPIDLSHPQQLFYVILALLVMVFLFLNRMLASPFGRVLMGIKSNEQRMLSLGYRTFYYKLAAFAIAGGLAGVAGALYTILFGFVTPEILSWHQSGNVLLMVILGGIGNLTGAILGALSFIAMQETFSTMTKHWQLLMGGTIVLVVLFFPGGIAAIPQRIKQKYFTH